MNEVTLPPSPNWYLNSIFTCAKDGTIAWGARNTIVIARQQDNCDTLSYSIINNAHYEKVTSLAFSPEYGQQNKNLLISASDESTVKIWDTENLSTVSTYTFPAGKQSVVGVDWSPKDPNIAYCVSSQGAMISWNVSFDAYTFIILGKLIATCLSCCPHNANLVAIGSKNGLIYIVDTRGLGSVLYKLRGHNVEITSLSWCPVENNILNDKNSNDLLLASGSKDKSIFIWRAGGDGRCQIEIMLPNRPLDSHQHRSKFNTITGNWTAVCWAEPKLLLTSSAWGELLSWDLSLLQKNKPISKLIHAHHARGLFCIATAASNWQTVVDKWRTENSITIWTIAQDRKIICCNIKKNNVEIQYNIPTQGGYIYCIAACPVDTSRIAFGAGDAILRLWNLSEPHKTSFDITVFWQKIMGNIRAIAWHPEKENLIAYATEEGRIGVFDTNGNKLPVLYRQYHRKTIYSLKWGPNPDTKNYALYSCGEGDLVYNNEETPNNESTVVISKKCTEFSWKPDFSWLAIGLKNGIILLYNHNLKECGRSVTSMDVAVHCLVWHPESTATDLKLSPLRNYLAIAYDASVIKILNLSDFIDKMKAKDISDENVDNDEKLETFSDNTSKVVASLNGHSNKILCLSWSQHFSGYLISSSYDCTVQVWNIETQVVVATFLDHCGPIYCCMWSPLDSDLIITGSADFTVRIWRLSSQKIVMPSKKGTTKKIKVKKNDQQINEITDCKTSSISVINKSFKTEGIDTATIVHGASTTESVTNTIVKDAKKKYLKSLFFPSYSKVLNKKSATLQVIKNLINDDENIQTSTLEEHNTVTPSLFSTEENFAMLINNEKSILTEQGNHTTVMELDLLCGNLKDNLKVAAKEKRLNAYLVSLSSSLSMKTWKETCEAYANQLIFEGNTVKAVSYLLCIHKIYEAIEAFLNAKMFKEAYFLCRSKLDSDDKVITTVLQKWLKYEVETGHFELAALCCIKLGNLSEAATLLARCKDVESLETAAKLAVLSEDNCYSKTLAKRAVWEALRLSKCEIAQNIISKFPEIKCLEIQVITLKEINKVLGMQIDLNNILAWMKGESEYGILQTLQSYADTYKTYYTDLNLYNVNIIPENQDMLRVIVSYHVAMALICDSEEKRLSYLTVALNTISLFEIEHCKREKNYKKLLILILCNLDAKHPIENEESIYALKISVSKSLRAYLCIGLMNWLLDYINLNEEEKCFKIIRFVEDLFEDVFDQYAVKYWSITNKVTQLETLLTSNLGKIHKKEEDVSTKEDDTSLLEELDDLKHQKRKFIEERMCSPSPVLAYSKAHELSEKLSNKLLFNEFTSRLSEIWTKAIS